MNKKKKYKINRAEDLPSSNDVIVNETIDNIIVNILTFVVLWKFVSLIWWLLGSPWKSNN